MAATDGNITCRLDKNRLLVTPSGRSKALITADDLLEVDLKGKVLMGQGRPSSELAVHLAAYEVRPEIQAVVHAHPPFATALTASGRGLNIKSVPEVMVGLGRVPVVPYATTGSPELAEAVKPFFQKFDGVLLDHHGTVALGASLENAWARTEKLETASRVVVEAERLGGAIPLPAEERALLRKKGGRENQPALSPASQPQLNLAQRVQLKTLPFTSDFAVEKHWQDNRGQVHLIINDLPVCRIGLLTLNQGSGFRGGHVHQKKQEGFYVVSGQARVELACPETGQRLTYDLGPGSRLWMQPGVAHRITALSDLCFVEFTDSPYDPEDDAKFDFAD